MVLPFFGGWRGSGKGYFSLDSRGNSAGIFFN